MLRQILAVTLVAFVAGPSLALGDDGIGGDICQERPDLCASTSRKPARKAKKAALKDGEDLSAEFDELPSTKPAPKPAAPPPLRKTASQTKCRMPHAAFDPDQEDLPFCKPKPKTTAAGHRRLDEMSTTPDQWDDLMNANAAQAPAPAPKPTPPPVPRLPATSSTVVTSAPKRAPAMAFATPVTPVKFTLPPPPKPAAQMSFEEYMAQNASNPALSSKIDDHQKAFADLSKPAIITIPGADPEPVAAAAAAATPSAGGIVIPAAAAAAAAAAGYTIPGASTTPPPGPLR
jgi:hypothetical protein